MWNVYHFMPFCDMGVFTVFLKTKFLCKSALNREKVGRKNIVQHYKNYEL